MARSVYTEPWVVLACKRTGAKCIEVQHGVITPDNIYYQSPVSIKMREDKLIFPTYILTLADEWKKILISQESGYDSDNTFTLGVKEELKRTFRANAETLNVLICLQHGIYSIDNILESFFSKYGKQIEKEGISIFIRPHPNAFSATNLKYKYFVGSNIMIQDSREIKLIDSLCTSQIMISPSSMCLYEAMALGIPTASFEKFKGVTIPDGLKYLKDEEDMWAFILDVKAGNYKQMQIPYLCPYNPRVLDKFIL